MNDTRVVASHKRLYYTLTRTSIPNHASNIKDMKYALIRSIENTESLTKSVLNTESDWQ